MQSKSGYFRGIATIAVALHEKISAAFERRRIRGALSKLDDYMLKDMGIALREGRRMGLALPGLELAERLYREVVALGHGRSGTQALILAVERLAQSEPSDL